MFHSHSSMAAHTTRNLTMLAACKANKAINHWETWNVKFSSHKRRCIYSAAFPYSWLRWKKKAFHENWSNATLDTAIQNVHYKWFQRSSVKDSLNNIGVGDDWMGKNWRAIRLIVRFSMFRITGILTYYTNIKGILCDFFILTLVQIIVSNKHRTYNKPIPKISHVKTLQNLCKMRYI